MNKYEAKDLLKQVFNDLWIFKTSELAEKDKKIFEKVLGIDGKSFNQTEEMIQLR